jgi:hypothetical protein
MTAKRRDCESQPGFLGWLRDNERLDSIKQGVVATDSDVWIHKYKTLGSREYQFLMLLEIKEHGKQVDKWQRDTLHIANQLLRNRRNKTKFQASSEPRVEKVFSVLANRHVSVCCFGVHSLIIHGDGRDTSTCKLTWDSRHEITADQLESLLLFEMDPDDLSRLDHRPSGKGGRHQTHYYTKRIVSELGLDYEKPFVRRS